MQHYDYILTFHEFQGWQRMVLVDGVELNFSDGVDSDTLWHCRVDWAIWMYASAHVFSHSVLILKYGK